ncbi:hypothetical protein [Thalassospira lohafexi]|uniref:Solute-binding protein family 3/N-terminal domain-containing protein n=1 Tax=Thalassospira lohafexi TaxID=744227 RepID=A0A2N3LBG8_9PROT|nr:hypothetical protein [Thalassospira lohafexi]PKR60129.1 hypothetical protein COO92_01820 [Thalassospira lohafexi]
MRIRLLLTTVAALIVFYDSGVKGAKSQTLTDDQVILMPVSTVDIVDINNCIASQSEDCRKCATRGISNLSLMNYTLLREALHAGGLKTEVRPVESPNSERSRKMVASGAAHVKTDWTFNIAENEDVLETAPVIRSGEIEKGLYANSNLVNFFAEKSLEGVHELRAVGIRTWRLDWQVLESLNPASLTSAATKSQLFSLIDAGRADFTLLEFSSSENMGREIDGIRLFPIAGVKVALPESQHFMVSRKLKNANAVVQALNRGIKTLRQNGFIRQCLVNSGMINPDVDEWRTLPGPVIEQSAKERASPSN